MSKKKIIELCKLIEFIPINSISTDIKRLELTSKLIQPKSDEVGSEIIFNFIIGEVL